MPETGTGAACTAVCAVVTAGGGGGGGFSAGSIIFFLLLTLSSSGCISSGEQILQVQFFSSLDSSVTNHSRCGKKSAGLL